MADQGNLYQKLIMAAQDRLDRAQPLPDTLEDLARQADLDPAEAIRCFANMEELREGLLYHSVVLLNDALRRGMVGAASRRPDRQLRSLAHSYSEWASANPTLFRLLNEGLNAPMTEDSALYRFTMSMRDLFERKFQEMCDLQILDPKTDLRRLILMLHCLVRGGNSVIVEQATDPWLGERERLSPTIAAEIFDDFLDCVIATHAPRARLAISETLN